MSELLDSSFVFAAIATLAAGVSRGMLGFGAALIVVPALVVLYGPIEAVVVMSFIEVPATLFLLPTTLRESNWSWVTPIGLGSLVTIPLGAWLLVQLDPDLTRRIIAAIVVILGLALASGWRYTGAGGLTLRTAVGALSGFIGGLANVGGPIVVVFLLATNSAAGAVRAGIMAFFSFSTAFRLVVYGSLGVYSVHLFTLSVLLAPVYLIGIWLGANAFSRLPETYFRRLAIGVVIITGTVAGLK